MSIQIYSDHQSLDADLGTNKKKQDVCILWKFAQFRSIMEPAIPTVLFKRKVLHKDTLLVVIIHAHS